MSEIKTIAKNTEILLLNDNCLGMQPLLFEYINKIDLIICDPPYNISKENDNRDRSKLNSPIMRRESPLRYDFGE
jgi:DNA modification methylase